MGQSELYEILKLHKREWLTGKDFASLGKQHNIEVGNSSSISRGILRLMKCDYIEAENVLIDKTWKTRIRLTE